jgi:hypothetical protein
MGLSIEQKPCWTVVCDQCGEGDNADYGGCLHHHDEAAARESAQSMDMVVLADGRALCLECFEDLRAKVPCPHGAGCTGGGCGSCPTDEQVVALAQSEDQTP